MHTPVNPSFVYKSGVQGGIHFTDMLAWCTGVLVIFLFLLRTYNLCLIKNKKNITLFHLKIVNFTANFQDQDATSHHAAFDQEIQLLLIRSPP